METEYKFLWSYCDHCFRAYIICPKCGNNCCNGGRGEIDGVECDVCPLAYEFQDKNRDYRPKKFRIWEEQEHRTETEEEYKTFSFGLESEYD